MFIPVTSLHWTVITETLGSCELLPLQGHYHLYTALLVLQSTVRIHHMRRCVACSHNWWPLLSYVTQRLTLLLLMMMEMMLT
jgi:hypothetical protein